LDSKLNYAAGAFLPKKVGMKIEKGEKIGTLFCDDKNIGNNVTKRISECYTVSNTKIAKEKLIIKIMR
jgi:thymidine phosphorylase